MKQFSEVKTEVSGNLVKFEVADSGTVNPGDVIAVIEEKP
jgi:biotin carboxyl carrier protein